MFVVFLLIARHIELKTRITATALLDRSAKIIPQTAKLVSHKGAVEVPVIELQKGDKILISPGETLPVDGRLLSAKSSFDESLLTGESLPITRLAGEQILGGSINVDQVIEVEVIAGRTDSTLNEIHQLTQKSINYRPYYVDIAEQVAGKFVAIILLIASATFLFWYWKDSTNALSHMISVLIVTCPCALALAAPVALSLGAAGLNHLHVLAVRMSSIEKLSYVNTIVFDKTGTLTAGAPIVKTLVTLGELDKQSCLTIASSLEKGSQHPFAKAILKAAEQTLQIKNSPQFVTKDLKQYSGQGVEALIDKELWRLGNSTFTHTKINSLDGTTSKQIIDWRNKGYSTLYLSNSNGLQAIFCIIDPLRDGIKDFLQQADTLGIKRCIILSGDHQQSVDAIAAQLGISEAHGGLSPQDKLSWIQKLQKQQAEGKKIMMLGDGVNDAPTLAAADVSLTFSDATDLAQSNCDLILLGKDYKHLGAAFALMRDTRKIILQNLGWAVAYNVVAIPAAAIGWVTPWMAAIGMSLSSLLVVLNSLRLKRLL